jgi:hypothetical protein
MDSKMFLVLCIALFILFLIVALPRIPMVHHEGFVSGGARDDTDRIIVEIYNQVLQRQPSGKEILAARTQLENRDTTLEGLRKRLIDSDEYERLMKTQSNVLAPELTKMISDESVLTLIKQLYLTYRQSVVPKFMLLPLRDIYIYLNYNRFKLSAALRHKNYSAFEKDLKSESVLVKDYVLRRFLYFFKMADIDSDAKLLQEEYEREHGVQDFDGANPYASVNHQDTDSTAMLNEIMKNMKENQARNLCGVDNGIGTGMDPGRMYTSHKGDMVLRPEFEWAVPQPRPPVCTTLGQPAIKVAPVFSSSSGLLLGTPLGEAQNGTGVGSIMPPFEYKEYIDVHANAQGKNPYDSAQTTEKN